MIFSVFRQTNARGIWGIEKMLSNPSVVRVSSISIMGRSAAISGGRNPLPKRVAILLMKLIRLRYRD